MSGDKKTTEWLLDFQSFLKVEEAVVPESISRGILSHVHVALNPPFRLVAAKLFAAHALSAFVITLFCPQLGVGPVIGGHGIMMLFMQFGSLACAALCGALFLGTSAFFGTCLLRKEELRVAGQHRFLNVTFLAAITFTGLILAGGDADRLTYGFWIFGAIVGGWSVMRLGDWVRLERPIAALA